MEACCRDTQEWSALCFAADRGRGDAARALLEAGADPDAPTKDGLLAAEIAGAKGHDALREVIERFSRRKSLLADVPAEAKKQAWEIRWEFDSAKKL